MRIGEYLYAKNKLNNFKKMKSKKTLQKIFDEDEK